ncbi:hypothetical protein BC474_05585 [Neisseria meningitidis]|nr:hypothetical protein BC474_05585 [Neisseria meningitidis]
MGIQDAKSQETVLPDKFPHRQTWIPACAGMTAERFLFFPVNTHKLKSRYFHKNRKPKTET